VYKDQNIDELITIAKNDVNYFWIFISLCCGLLSHFSRTIRWNMLIESLGKKPRSINTFLAVMVGYFANLALPRMGEISRCGIISKYENISFSKLVGTVVLERILDIIMLLIFLCITMATQYDIILSFLHKHTVIKEKLSTIFASQNTLLVISIIIITVIIVQKYFKENKIIIKINTLFSNFKTGFKSIKKLDNKILFLSHTVFIWLMYYLMTYLCFFSFGFTSDLPALAGLTVFVMGAFGMVAPVQGGIGAWHFMVIGTLITYLPNIENINSLARSFAFVVHGSQTGMIIIVGALSVIALPFVNKKKKLKNS